MKKISLFEIFKIGVGPSGSYAMGPWNVAKDFLTVIKNKFGSLDGAHRIDIKIFCPFS